jgi:hypothetical protein
VRASNAHHQVIEAFPWADLIMADDVTKLVIESPVSKAAARIRYVAPASPRLASPRLVQS